MTAFTRNAKQRTLLLGEPSNRVLLMFNIRAHDFITRGGSEFFRDLVCTLDIERPAMRVQPVPQD